MKQHFKKKRKRSIFQAIFFPLIFVMILQSVIFYVSAVYGGVEDSLNQNASDILAERMTNRKNEIETKFNKDWIDLDNCQTELDTLYHSYTADHGETPFVDNTQLQIQYISDATDILIQTLRENQTNGIFLILNDTAEKTAFSTTGSEVKYGCSIRDMDSTSAYTEREDLLLERMPSSIVEQSGCSLDSWWEAFYTFGSKKAGEFYYNPLDAAWNNPDAAGEDLAYIEGAHRLSSSDQDVISYSIPLMDDNGRPYAVLGIELTAKYLQSLLPNKELGDSDKTCYVLAMHNVDKTTCIPCAASGSMYNRSFRESDKISCTEKTQSGGFLIDGQNGTTLYATMDNLNIYNNNNPFEKDQLVLIAMIDKDTLFYYSQTVKFRLLLVASLSLLLGVACIFIVSHRFALPITSLAKKARKVEPQQNFHLPHLEIEEIDQLVDSIEVLSKNASKEIARIEFFSRMSHDMRTPMNAIISFSSTEILEGADEEKKDAYLQKIHTSGEYLLGLINEVLDMTKIESRKVDLHYEAVPITSLLDTVISLVEELANAKQVRFEKIIDMPENISIMTDTQHLNQILLNLLSNAVKFSHTNGTVLLKCHIAEQENQKLCCDFTVQDNGIGMSKSFMEKLYQPFEQEQEGHGGTGLGLSISKKLVELMGGTIQCTSVKNKGTTFQVTLTFDKALPSANSNAAETSMQIAPEEIDAILKGKKILICEDQPLNIQIAQRLLERKAMFVEVAENGQIALEKFSASPIGTFDAILMDIRMPVMDGLGASHAIRALQRSDAEQIPIIAMTANAFAEDIQKSREAGMNEHLSKPIEPKKLYSTLAKYLHSPKVEEKELS